MAQMTPQRGNGTGAMVIENEKGEARNWMRIGGIIGLLVFCAGVGGAVYAGGAGMAEKASRESVDALRSQADARLDALEQERAATLARLKSIDEKLDNIESKLNRLIPWPP